MENSKLCKSCSKIKPLDEFAEWAKGHKRRVCKECYSAQKAIKQKQDRKDPQKNESINNRRRAWRQEPENRVTVIYQDTRNSDKKKLNQTNDLTKEFIENSIKNGCHYCGETELQMTLDRINNSLPHNQDNVLPACIRCNLIRREMPFECWMHLVPSVKGAKELGLFNNWENKFKRK